MEKSVKFILLAGFLLIPFPTLLIANGPPINSDSAFVTGLNGAAFRSFFKVLRKSKSGLGNITVLSQPLILPYEVLANQLVLVASLPLVLKDRRLATGQHRSSHFGIGDFTFLGKYNLYQHDWHSGTFRVAGKAGLQFPTGITTQADNLGVLPRTLQNGKGSWNPLLGAVMTFLLQRFGFNAGIAYQLNTPGSGYEFGDAMKYDLAFAFRLIPSVYKVYPEHQINAFIELNGEWKQRDRSGGVIAANTGGNVIYLSPGIQYMYESIIFEASFQVAILTAFIGNQLEPQWALNFGFRWLIF